MIKRYAHRWAIPHRPLPCGAGRDAGMTLAEVMVSMALTSVVMALVTTGIVQMYRFTDRSDVLSTEMTQVQVAFQQLDRSVRYATAISQPNTTASAGGGWYVEWSSVSAGATSCTQLRLNERSGLLQRRSKDASAPAGSWVTVASFLTGSRPFTLQPATSSGFPHQRLTVDVTVRPDANSSQAARRSAFSFTALNTSLLTTSSTVCTGLDRP
ncbi:prepilin-type N-terminal cleavage/methylation domain-containing protein [Actinoplanes sp. TFC3]|uniref:prepilin-type N-terminal cleavage/methylation domain-containing protein n=1 Tax=Actinoplanes sp. TFC3 TaxID=1710355 RepID=UPI0008332F38|nr:prepilin-type N-terminal cleavage/methylation domain-containing protein [Actinoplanes sp. TFC3]